MHNVGPTRSANAVNVVRYYRVDKPTDTHDTDTLAYSHGRPDSSRPDNYYNIRFVVFDRIVVRTAVVTRFGSARHKECIRLNTKNKSRHIILPSCTKNRSCISPRATGYGFCRLFAVIGRYHA